MKPLIFFLFGGLMLFSFRPLHEYSKSTLYYFCISHSMYPQSIKGKQTILYTPVYKFEGEANDISKRVAAWGDYVRKVCENNLGCTSDLNTYPTFESANEQQAKAKEYYSDTTKFILKKVELR